jgi:hypothetical protein
MFKGIASFLLGQLSKPAIVELIKAQIPKLSDEQKAEILEVVKQLISAAAAGAVQGATTK